MQSALRLPAVSRPFSGWARGLTAAVMAAGAWAASAVVSEAEARDSVYWSIGIQSPGVAVGVANAPPVVYGPPAGYYYQPRPVVVAPQPIYYYDDDYRPRHWKKGHKHHRWHDGRRHGRGHDRWDD